MSNEESSDERKNYAAVQKLIDTLLEFNPETRGRILQTVHTFFGVETQESNSRPFKRGTEVPKFANREDLSPKDFLFQKKPKTDMERVTCLAYYLMHFRNTVQFKTMDISKLNTEAAQIKFSNASNGCEHGYSSRIPCASSQRNKTDIRTGGALPLTSSQIVLKRERLCKRLCLAAEGTC